jgi:mannose-6-phosphate isomerase-like protein (cupin superfamily)
MRPLLAALLVPLLFAGSLAAQDSAATPALHFIAVPPILLPGAQIAIVSGDPSAPGPCTVELIMPDGYRMPPHSHPVDEHVQVLEGTLLIGLGDKLDARKTMPAQAGDTGTAPAGAHHNTVAKGRTRIRVSFMGPYTITYVNSYEVPRQPSFPIGY